VRVTRIWEIDLKIYYRVWIYWELLVQVMFEGAPRRASIERPNAPCGSRVGKRVPPQGPPGGIDRP
jgi:hypothetical protein